MSDDFYVRPIVCVRDVRASMTYYHEKLGFKLGWSHPADRPIIAQVARDGFDLILDSGSVIPRAAIPSVISLSVDDRLGSLHRELTSRGAEIASAPLAVHWQPGVHEFQVKDIDGNLLVFWGDEPS